MLTADNIVQQPTKPRNVRRTAVVIGLGIGVLFIIIFLSIPATRRRIVNAIGQPAVVGATAIEVRGDWFQNHLYAPAVVQVPVGSTIRWTFNDRGANGSGELVGHNVVGEGWSSPVLSEGVFEHTFTTAGSYRYTCSLHGAMDGMVVVTE